MSQDNDDKNRTKLLSRKLAGRKVSERPSGARRRNGQSEDDLLLPFKKPEDEEARCFADSISKTPRFTISTLGLTVLCALLLGLLGFFSIQLPSPLIDVYPNLDYIQYGFQLSFALFLGAILGPVLGTLAVLMYLACGLFLYPVFAGGGGLNYAMEPGFGYLLGMVAGTFASGRVFRKCFNGGKSGNSLHFLLVMVAGVMTAHLVGALYLAGLMLAGHFDLMELKSWFLHLTGEPVFYDVIVTWLLLLLVRPLRACLWFALY